MILVKVKSLLDAFDLKGKDETAPMTKDQTDIFIRAFLQERHLNKQEPFAGVESLSQAFQAVVKDDFGMKLLISRLSPETKITFTSMLFLLTLCDGPGHVVMWAYTLHRLSQKLGGKLITLSVLAEEWPVGFPTDAQYKACWFAQKGMNAGVDGVDNLLDRQEFWEYNPA
jgi:hypothetical protein